MNELVIPPAPLWYKNAALACAPDNTLIYGAKNDIVIVQKRGPDEAPEVQLIHGAHSKSVVSVSLNKNWKEPHAYVASLGEENAIKVWDASSFEKKFVNTVHTEHKEGVIGAVFAGDDRVVSASINGLVIVWNITINETKSLDNLFGGKVTLTCLSSCPHKAFLVAFGLSNGCVVLVDVRRNGTKLYNLRGHYQAVLSLSWCPAPVNIFPRYIRNSVKNKSDEKPNPWVNLTHADDGEVPQESNEVLLESATDFLKHCDDLKAKILGLGDDAANSGDNQSDDDATTPEEPKYEEKGIKETDSASVMEKFENDVPRDFNLRSPTLENNRPLPKLFDPSGDFLDDSVLDTTEDEVFEDKDAGDEKNKDINKDSSVETEQNKPTGDGENGDVNKDSSGETSTFTQPIIEEEPRVEYLLASVGKDRTVHIWRAGTDGRLQTMFRSPKRMAKRDKPDSNTWMSLCWIAPDRILTTTQLGEVLSWVLPKPRESSKQFKVVHHQHNSTIFNMVAPPKYSTAYNWRDNNDLSVWTWGQDGRLIDYDIKNNQIRSCYETITATVTCFDASSLDPNRLAIGVRDGSVRVWDLSLPHTTTITMHKYQQKITQKVSTLAWNPKNEMVLGFGTEEGRVGYIETSSKKSTLFAHFFRTQVYKVEWGPIGGNASNLGLYALAEGQIVIYDMAKPKGDPIQLELPEQLHVYKFSWKPDFSLLLLNGKDGSLISFTPDFSAINTVYLHDKGFNAVAWHPDAYSNSTDSSRYNWLAVTTTKGVLVYDCSLLKENSAGANLMEKIVVNFEGHLRAPLAVAWSPFDGDRLVSAAPDGLVHVWDVQAKTAISTFADPYFYYNQALIWSPVDSDFVIIGDRFVRVWSISKNPPKIDEAERKSILAKSAKTAESDKTKIKVELPKVKNGPKNCVVPAFYVSNDENLELQVKSMRRLMMEKDSSILINPDQKIDPLQLFGEKDQVSSLLTAHYLQQKKEAKFKSCELVSLWKGNMANYITEALLENRITPSLVTLAPMVSLKLWQDCCESYAKSLLECSSSDPVEIAMYFLACHKIEEAIDCLCLNLMFKEALALAKERLPNCSDIINGVTNKWAEHCVNTGNFETAAYCYISIGEYSKAAKVLARRNNREFLEFAAELADKMEDKALSDSIKFKINELNTPNEQIEAEEELPSRIEAELEVATNNGNDQSCEAEVSEKNPISED